MSRRGIRAARRRGRLAWCLYDWANSPFPTVIVTFVFSAYFAKAVAENEIVGTAQWGYAVAVCGIALAVLSPVFGAVADRMRRRKPWLGAFTALCIVASAALWFAAPDPSFALYALVCFVIANTAFEIGMVFYNAMLPGIVSPARIGRLSGWGWGLGYLGGLLGLVLVLFAFVQTPTPLFGLDKAAAEHIRVVGPVVAVWFAVFSVPIFLFTPDGIGSRLTPREAVGQGLRTLAGTVRSARSYGNIVRYLVARLLYVDGMNTMFAFGGIYAAGTFGMSVEEIIQFGIAMNVTAGLGAAVFGWIDDWLGSKRTIVIALLGLMGFGVPLLLVEGKMWFWIVALPLGLFMGPAQSASRALMSRIAPAEMRTEMFGLYALSGRLTSFVGPAALAWATTEFASQRVGMSTILVLLLGGLLLLLPVREERSIAVADSP